MSSSRQSRRRHQQRSFRRHQLRIESLEKRYALDGTPDTSIDEIFPLLESVQFNGVQFESGAVSHAFTVLFSESVTGVDGSDFEVVTTGSAVAAVGNPVVTGIGSTYTVLVTASGEGQVGVNVLDDGSIRDLSGNPLRAKEGELSFADQVTFATGFEPQSLRSGDLNNDGHLDFVVATNEINRVDLFYGDGTGAFSQQTLNYVHYATTPNIYPRGFATDVAIADLNGDGLLDIGVADWQNNYSYNKCIWVRINNGYGSFQNDGRYLLLEDHNASYPSNAASPGSITFVDVNNDSSPDMIAGDLYGTNYIRLNNGDGSFGSAVQVSNSSSTGWGSDYQILDVNSDGMVDLVGISPPTVSLGNGDGSFQSPSRISHLEGYIAPGNSEVDRGAMRFDIGDLNNDGIADIVFPTTSSTVAALLGAGDGTFDHSAEFSSEGTPFSVAVADFDGDGFQETVSANHVTNTAEINYWGYADGTIPQSQSFTVGRAPHAVITGDWNADGRQDIAVVNLDDATLGILFQQNNQKYVGPLVDVVNPENVNQPPTSVTLLAHHTNVPETASTTSRLAVGSFMVADDDKGTNTVTITGTDADSFEIDGNIIYLKQNTVLDYEEKTNFELSINAFDATLSQYPIVTTSFTLLVDDIDETMADQPLLRQTIGFNLYESQGQNAYSSNMQITDSGASRHWGMIYSYRSGTVKYTISLPSQVRSRDVALATLVAPIHTPIPDGSTGRLYANQTLLDSASGVYSDQNPTAGTEPIDVTSFVEGAHNIEVRGEFSWNVTGPKFLTSSAENDALSLAIYYPYEAPTDLTLSTAPIAEDAVNGTVVGSLLTVDADIDLNDRFTYQLVDGIELNDNAYFEIVGSDIVLKTSLDYESKTSHSIRIRSTDGSGLYTEKEFVIQVEDVDDNKSPTLDENSDINLNEDDSARSVGLLGLSSGDGLVIVPEESRNLIVNGSFADGNTGFNTEYTDSGGNSWPGGSFEYAIVDNDGHSGDGRSLYGNSVNHASTTTGNQLLFPVIWSQSVSVTPGETYDFSAWVKETSSSTNPSILEFTINSEVVGEITAAGSWRQFASTWNSGSSVQAEIMIVEVGARTQTPGGGNDFAIDDIEFKSPSIQDQPLQIDVTSSDSSLIAASSLTTSPVNYGDLYQWTESSGGNGHWYELVSSSLSWETSREAAQNRGGDLAVVTTSDEIAFLTANVSEGYPWLGGYQDSSEPGFSEPESAWKWINDESWTGLHWRSDEPNDPNGSEQHLGLNLSQGKFFDADGTLAIPERSYLVEYETDPRLLGLQSGQFFLTPQSNQHGTATITVTVEDGGLDNDLGTQGDNATLIRTFDVTVNPVNDPPIGTVTVSGIAEEDQMLTATNDLADNDGLGDISYQWSRNGVEISGATASTYTFIQEDVGTAITATASYTDNDGTLESVVSSPTSTVVNVNDNPTGGVTITGVAAEDEVLTAGNDLTDEDGLGVIAYQWKREGVAIDGATDSTYTLMQADIGASITVTASYLDQGGTNESVTSAGTQVVTAKESFSYVEVGRANQPGIGNIRDFNGTTIASHQESGSGTVHLVQLAPDGTISAIESISGGGSQDRAGFGYSVTLQNSLVGIGSPVTSSGGLHSGQFYTYDLSTSGLLQSLNPAPHTAQYFGEFSTGHDGYFSVGEGGNSGWNTESGFTVYAIDADSKTVSQLIREDFVSAGDGYSHLNGLSAARDHIFGLYRLEAESEYVLFARPIIRNENNDVTQVGPAVELRWPISDSTYTPTNSGRNYYVSSSPKAFEVSNNSILALGQANSAADNDAGVVKLLRITNGAFEHFATLAPPSVEAGMSFGRSLAWAGTKLFVSAPQATTTSSGTGAVYVYDIANPDSIAAPRVITSDNLAPSEVLGEIIAANGDSLVASVGANSLVSFTVNHGPQAPVLDSSASPQLSAVDENIGFPVGQVGTLVSGLIDSGETHNNFSDVDGGQPGIAIAGVNLQGGTLHYSIDNGATWSDVGAVSEASPRLLLADGTTRLYFEPANEFNGSISDVITIRAWDRNAVWTQLGIDIDGESAGSRFGNPVSLSSNGQIVAAGAPKFGDNGSEAGYVRIYQWSDDSWQQMGEDINGDAAGDRLHTVAASSDGMTIAVGAYLNDGNGTDAGHVKVYRWQTETTSWVQRGSDIEGDVAGDNAGYRVSMSSDGNTVAISARTSDGNGTDSGHVRVYQWDTSSDSWLQRGADIHGEEAGDQAAYSLAISGDGNTLTIGSVENSTNGSKSGSVRVFQWNNVASSWNQLGSSFYGSGSMHQLGFSTALSEDGSIFALGAVEHYGTGYARVFQWNGVANSWIQRGVDIAGESYGDFAGHSVSLSSNGNRLIVGAVGSDELGVSTGQLRVFDWNSTDSNWQQSEKFHGEAGDDNFGHTSGISRDGSTIAVGAYQNDGNGSNSGHVRVFRLSPSADSLSLNSDTVSIEVTPLTAPTDITLSNSAVGENSQGAIVGQLTTTDPDVGDTFTYTLVPGSGDTDNSLFYIEGDSFRVGTNLDYETSTTANVRIRTTDSHGEYFENAFIIGVQNYNEPPTDIVLSSSSIEENQLVGSVVGTLTSADPDGNGFGGFAESFTYSLASGTGDTDNSSFDVVEDELRTKESFNFEIKDSYSVRLRTEDNMGVPYEKQFVVSVENVNELPTLNAVSPITINENENEQAVNLSGVTAGDIESQSLRVFATSSNQNLIPDPTVTYTSSNSTGSLAFTPVSSQHGVASITVTVEDGGLDNDLLTPEDNETVQQMFQVTVLEVISNTNSAILAKDGSDSLYVSTQYAKVRPVTYQGQQVPQSFFQFAVVGADASTAQNALMFKSLGSEGDGPTHRVLTDDQWRISDLFNSLHNEESTVLHYADRQVSVPLNIVAVAGAYEINGVNNPTFIVQRGQSYVINLNVEDHPFFLQTTGNGFNRSTIYRNFYGNGQTKGEYRLVIRDDAPDELFYQCKFHQLMFGKIIVID